MEKAVTVRCGDNLHDVVIKPATTAAEILQQLNLPDGYSLHSPAGVPFGYDEVVWEGIPDGGKIIATPSVDVG